ncbi:YdcH family protein [Hyphomicrobium sp. CS1GBMeth3]|uniref:YdcH family protein n=1 Tax=Hyphomicrobium sp. CS1GBMeth3 TaxID=1892845 RepID=UPI000931BEAA|nr:YdcH family protein [Hyphomicrobium sp. CS1GBMeth3]
MSNTPHTLAEEFPGQAEAIHKLKVADPHFARLLQEYDGVNDQVHLAETNIQPIDQFEEEKLRKRRLQIKDEIAEALSR